MQKSNDEILKDILQAMTNELNEENENPLNGAHYLSGDESDDSSNESTGEQLSITDDSEEEDSSEEGSEEGSEVGSEEESEEGSEVGSEEDSEEGSEVGSEEDSEEDNEEDNEENNEKDSEEESEDSEEEIENPYKDAESAQREYERVLNRIEFLFGLIRRSKQRFLDDLDNGKVFYFESGEDIQRLIDGNAAMELVDALSEMSLDIEGQKG